MALKAKKGLSRKSLVRKPTKLARKPLKRVQKLSGRRKKTPEAKLKEELWALCKQITRKRYGNTCYTCGKTGLIGSSWQTGHFIPSSICGNYLRYDLRDLRIQCYRCNIDLSGNGSVFYRNLVSDEGQSYVDQLFADKERITKLNRAFLEETLRRNMSRKSNTQRGGKKVKKYGGGSGMKKHGTSGVSHNHAVSIAMAREAAKEIEQQAEIARKRKGKLYGSVKEVFNSQSRSK